MALRASSGKRVEVTLSELVLALRMRCHSEHTSELHGRPATRDDPQPPLGASVARSLGVATSS